MTVEYYYNIDANCYNISSYDFDERMQASYLFVECKTPVNLILNNGLMTINDTKISINISQNQIDSFKYYICPTCDYVQMAYSPQDIDATLVSNLGRMNVNRLYIGGFAFCRIIFYNANFLYMNQIYFDVTYLDKQKQFDPNTLQSNKLIKQSSSTAQLIIFNAMFVGSVYQIVSDGGSVKIYNSTFKYASRSIVINAGKNIVIYQCMFYHIGRYYSVFGLTMKQPSGSNTQPIFDVSNSIEVSIQGNTFSDCFDDYGVNIIRLQYSSQVILKSNIFSMNDSDLYYKLPYDKDERKDMFSFLYIEGVDISIIGNNFDKNDIKIHSNVPWIGVYSPDKFVCLSGNNFTNYALLVEDTPITSCFRPEIINCFNKPDYCLHGSYGNMNATLYQQISHFNVDVNFNKPIFQINKYKRNFNNIALDNIQINVIGYNSSYSEIKPLLIPYKDALPNFLLLDSVLFPTDVDIWYNEACDIISNDRLVDKPNYIARVMIKCNYSYTESSSILNLRNSSTLNFVDHFSATQIHFNAESSIYYPGKRLPFYWEIWDSLDNKIHTSNYSSKLTINLESQNNDFSFLQSININETGDCAMCESGVMIQSITLQHVLNVTTSNQDIHILTASIPDENLLLINNSIPLQLTLCPKGHGPDSSQYLCNECSDGHFNLKQHNSEPCHSCNEDDGGIKCYGGNIYISRNYWSGVSDDYRSIVTQQCPADYCCIEKQCNFENKSLLCAANRDPDTPFCGRCMTGYSQSMNSTKCTICLGNDYLWLFPAFMLSLVITFYLISCHSYSRHNQAKQDMQDNSADKERQGCIITILRHKEYMLMIKTFGARILLYYFQAITQVIWPSTIAVYIYTFASLFDLTINLGETGSGQWCFVEGLTTKQKILATGIPTLFIMGLCIFMCAWIYLLHYFGCEYNFKCCFKCFGKSIIRCRPCNTNFARVFVVMLLICVGQILSILFRLLNCQQIGSSGIYIHIYFGEEECLKTFTFYGALIGLFIVIIIFALMFAKLYKMSKQDRNDINQPLNSFCRYYEEQYYWWESVILSRRILIALLAMFYNNYYYMTMVVIVLLLFL
eukprot:299465_1